MKKIKPSVIPFLIVAAIGMAWLAASTLTFAPSTAHAQSISIPEGDPGGGPPTTGDPDNPDPFRAKLSSGVTHVGTGARSHLEPTRQTHVTAPAFMPREWLEVVFWSLRNRIGW